ncbi:DMT family transporter [Inhella gelatinilytica]|uniref:DMT family transporter n=1 Tax=Inhella gelatinilytica TaxID=2795030 RepID=A0A931NE45_9BURK|nr:DMT family transporter [Inhella gelatinilytica]MBH9552890.1 DMT family transporter [Inhella gelatinilytica]
MPAWLFLAASMALVGSYVGLSKALVAVFPVFLLAGLRFGLAALAMLHWIRRPAQEPVLNRVDHAWLFVCSFLGNFGFSICMLLGVKATSALSAGVVMALIPAAVAVLSALWLRERIAPRVRLAIFCSGVGIALLALARPSSGADSAGSIWGHLLLLGAVFCEAAYVVSGKRLGDKLSPRRITALINLWGLLLMAPLALWQAQSFEWRQVAVQDWGLLTFYALAASMFSVWLWMRGLEGYPASRAGVFTVLIPVSSATVGIFYLGEHATALHGLALLLALTGILLATRTPEPRRN